MHNFKNEWWKSSVPHRTLLWEISYASKSMSRRRNCFLIKFCVDRMEHFWKKVTDKKTTFNAFHIGEISAHFFWEKITQWEFDYFNVEKRYRLQRSGTVNSTSNFIKKQMSWFVTDPRLDKQRLELKCPGWRASESLIAGGSPILEQCVLKRIQKYKKN